MATTTVQYSNQGPRITVNAMIKDPLLVRARMLRMMDQQFIMEALLRNVGSTDSGVIQYEESSPQFLTDEPMVVAEAGEIPLGMGAEGLWKAAATVKLARGLMITREQRDRNRFDLVAMNMNRLRNTMIRAWETRLFNMLNTHPSVPTVATGGDPWTGAAPTIRADIMSAIQVVAEAKSTTTGGPNDYLGFNPDTLVISTRTAYTMLGNAAFVDIYKASPLVTKSPVYTGTLEKEVQGLTIMTSRFMPDDAAYVMERNVIGGYSDERPLTITPTREDPDRECWRSDIIRRTGMFLDQPQAAAKILIAA
jgi:hypothetical protein